MSVKRPTGPSGIGGTTPTLKPAKTQPVAIDSRYVISDRSGGSKWPGGLSASGRGTTLSHFTVRQNARTAMQDSPPARALVERMADITADCGLHLEMAPVVEVLGITQEEATKWSRNVEARFHLWASDRRQFRSEAMNFYQSMRLYQIFQHRDNDIFVRLYYDGDPTLQSPLQVDFIDPDQIRGDAYTTTWGAQGLFIDGIDRDERGRETMYHIWVRTNTGTYEKVEVPARSGSRVNMIHGYRPEYAGQRRGYSRLAHVLQEFENLSDFSASTIKKAINQASIFAFVAPSKDEDATNPLEGILTNLGAGPAAQMFGSGAQDAVVANDTTTQSLRPITECYQVPEATIDTPGSMFVANLTRGSDLKFPPATAPADSYDKFVDGFFTYIAASYGMPIEVILMKFGQNYSASRAALLLAWQVAVIWRNEMDSDYLSVVVEMWLACEIGAGRISAPGWSDPRLRAAWLNKNWIGTPPPDIDPTKTASARRMNIETNVTNLDREARDFNGTSAAANIEKNRTLFDLIPPSPWQPVGGAQPDMSKED